MTSHPRSTPNTLTVLLLLVGASLLLRALLSPATIERWYSRSLYVLLRWAFDATLGQLPFPLFYLFWVVVALVTIRFAKNLLGRLRTGTNVRKTALYAGRWLLQLLCWLVLIFLWGWGYNYARVPVEEQLGFATYEPRLEELRQRVFHEAAVLGELRAQITADTAALAAANFPTDLEATIRPLVAAALLRHGYPAAGRPRGWRLLPRGILLRLGTAGVYWPWVAQGNIDAGLHPLQQPAVLAHELAHAYGFGDEGTCSFWAQLTVAQTDEPLLRYALRLSYWRELAGRLRYADPEGYLNWRQQFMPPGIRNDLQAIYDNAARYTDIAPALRDATYTAYLHAQGIEEGLLNYGRVVRLVEGYERNYSPSR